MRLPGASLAGWVFADLLLALVVISIGVNAALPQPTPAPPPPPPPPSPTKEAAPPAKAVSVHQSPYCRAFRVDLTGVERKDPRAHEQVAQRIRTEFGGLHGARAAFVLTFGTAGSIGQAQQLAVEVNKVIAGAYGSPVLPELFGSAATRAYGYEHNSPNLQGKVWIEVFLLSTSPVLTSACPPEADPVE